MALLANVAANKVHTGKTAKALSGIALLTFV